MDRIIEVKITGCHLTKSSNLAGVTGEANVTALRIEFDDSWDGYAKTITWLNASGETATGFILTVDMLDDIIKSTRVYIAPIPKAALTLAGETLFSVDGYMNGKRQRSVYGKLIVRQGGEFEAIDDVDATTAEKIQLQLEGCLEEIQAALTGAEQARDKSVESAEAAKEYMESTEAAKDEISDAEKRLAEQISVIDENGEKLENKGVPNGYAPLDEFGKIPEKYLHTTYGVSIDLSNSNPETAVTYTDDAVGMVGGSSDWYTRPIFRDIKPCLFKNGAVVGYLNPNNFAQFEDGSAADITSGDAGDVMIEIPKIGYKISKIGTHLTVQITDDPNKDGFSCKAHTREREGDREKLYIGAFLGSNKDNKLRSISGVSPHATGLTDFRTYAKANGAGYDLFAFYPMTLLQCLYLVMYKNLNSQAAIGMGYVGDYDWEYMQKNTGATIDKGMSYGTTSEMEQMKFLGIEDFWGNLFQWIDGLVSTEYYHALIATDNFNDTGDGYTDLGALSTSYICGYMKTPQGTNETGFIIGEKGASSSTYFSDFAPFNGGFVPVFGGSFGDGTNAGAFRLAVVCSPGYAGGGIGGRLMYL